MPDKFSRGTRKKSGAQQGAFVRTKERAKIRARLNLLLGDNLKAVRAVSTEQCDIDQDVGLDRSESAVKLRGRNLRVVYDDARVVVTALTAALIQDRSPEEVPVRTELDLSKQQRAERHHALKKNKLRKRSETKLLHKLIK